MPYNTLDKALNDLKLEITDFQQLTPFVPVYGQSLNGHVRRVNRIVQDLSRGIAEERGSDSVGRNLVGFPALYRRKRP